MDLIFDDMKYTIDLPNLKILEERLSLCQFFEKISLKDLPGAVSGITSRSLDIRRTDPHANKDISVIETAWSKSSDTLTVYFNVAPTYLQGTTTVLSPSTTEYPGTFYNVVFQFSGVGQYLGDPNTFETETDKQQSALASALLNCEVKLYSNDPSFYYQGMWEDLASVGGALYSFPGPAGDDVWHNRHVASGGLKNPYVRITKHMAAITQTINIYIPQMLNKLRIVA